MEEPHSKGDNDSLGWRSHGGGQGAAPMGAEMEWLCRVLGLLSSPWPPCPTLMAGLVR